jgi:hypothetical protein
MKNLPYIFFLLTLLSSCDEKSNSAKETDDVLTDTLIIENEAKAENDEADNPFLTSPTDINRHIFYTENKSLPDTVNLFVGKEPEQLIIDTFTASYNLVISDIEKKYKPITIDYFYKGFYLIEKINGVCLKGVKSTFTYYSIFDESPSSSYQALVLITDNKLLKLEDMLKEADEENLTEPEFDYLNIFLPLKVSGKIKYKKIGFFENPESRHRDESFFEGEIVKGIPPSELYIIEKIKITDEGKQSKIIKFYRWDGRNSTVIK